MPTPSPTHLEPPEETHVTTDIPCVGCGYNLRTLSIQGKCPECGKPVEASISMVGLKQWPLNTEYACDLLGFGAAVVIFVGIGAILWLIGSFQLARKFEAEDPYAAILRGVTKLSVIALPVTLVLAIVSWPNRIAWFALPVIAASHYLAVHLIGIRLCRSLDLFKQELCCWALIAFEAITIFAVILNLSDRTPNGLSGPSTVMGFVWFVLLISTWVWISSDISARRAVIQGRYLRKLGKDNRRDQMQRSNAKSSA